ncbi:MAG: sigma-54-dependent Fis family transcriptional regulator [Methylococcaceae bacterium]|nr:sigma-54-dependent Fis family transcriptional regulator [Methylococcaceae bacterium]
MFLNNHNLMLFQPPSYGNTLFKQLSAKNWDVYLANDLQQASDLLDKHIFKVGLCIIEEKCSNSQCLVGKSCLTHHCSDTEQLTQLNRLFDLQSKINWVVALPKDCTPHSGVNQSQTKHIAEYCYNYLSLPVDIDQLLLTLDQAYALHGNAMMHFKKMNDYPSHFGIIGNSPAMLNLFAQLQKVSKEECSVLIEGDTGTGKELVANAIHNYSLRAEQPLVAINCGAFPKDLIQAELFGYEKGAFTGAHQRKIGCIESADGGTLFLDEIGDLPMEQQVNLLRFLEDRTIERIGGSEKIAINVRVIAATHVDISDAVQRGEFRQDLYYRLRVLQIKTPSLQSRENDIELLAYYFFNKFSANQSYKAKGFTAESLYLLKNYNWPGNVRELMNCIHHAVVMSDNRLLSPVDLGLDRRYKERMLKTLDEARAAADRETIITSLHYTNFNMSRAAEALGISRVSLYRLVDKYNIAMANS